MLQHDLHDTYGKLRWGIEAKEDQDGQPWRYCMRVFQPFTFIHQNSTGRQEVRKSANADRLEIIFNPMANDPLPDPALCNLHLAVCRVARACGAAKVLDMLFYHDPDLIGPAAGSYTLPADPDSGDFVLPYFERRLFEESLVVAPVS